MKTATRWDRHFARSLVDAAADGSGILKATKGKVVHLFCLEDGALVHAASNVLEEQLGVFLERRGTLHPTVRAEVEAKARVAGVKLARALLEQGLLLDADLTQGIEALVEELIASTLEWGEGEVEWSAGTPKLDGEVKIRLTAGRALARHAGRSATKPDAVRMRIGAPDVKLQVKEIAGAAPEMGELGAYLVAVCDGTRPLAEVVRSAPADQLATLRAVYGLVLAGRLEPAVSRRVVPPHESRGPEPELSREECLARLAVEGTDHYRVLAIDYEAGLDQVREAYYALARRYHPDRFRAGPLSDLLPRFEAFFTHVTDAYNTLSSGDRRSEYDHMLSSGRAKDPASTQKTDTAHLAKENYARARILLDRKRHQEAATFLENAVKLDPSRPEYHLELGIVLTRSGRRRDEAEEHLKHAVALAPASAPAHLALAQLYHRQGRLEETRRELEDTLRWDPQNATASALLAGLEEKKDAPQESGILRGLFRS